MIVIVGWSMRVVAEMEMVAGRLDTGGERVMTVTKRELMAVVVGTSPVTENVPSCATAATARTREIRRALTIAGMSICKGKLGRLLKSEWERNMI